MNEKQINEAVLEWTQIVARIGVSWNELCQMEAAGEFPARIADATGQLWWRVDVEKWIRNHPH